MSYVTSNFANDFFVVGRVVYLATMVPTLSASRSYSEFEVELVSLAKRVGGKVKYGKTLPEDSIEVGGVLAAQGDYLVDFETHWKVYDPDSFWGEFKGVDE